MKQKIEKKSMNKTYHKISQSKPIHNHKNMNLEYLM